jgi:hypothetical protein
VSQVRETENAHKLFLLHAAASWRLADPCNASSRRGVALRRHPANYFVGVFPRRHRTSGSRTVSRSETERLCFYHSRRAFSRNSLKINALIAPGPIIGPSDC